ncbi:Glycogen phosphorylase [bioreactor metagenome]|uniref:Glycogen phosphorylase n=1 Tax=bioreactor metagenome TaxID=1076179 RepID=A0A645INP0_9ZZZZ
MKFMMNGALTVGTLDGANVEMHDVLGDNNMFLFGLGAKEAAEIKPVYDPMTVYSRDEKVRRAVDQLRTGFGDGVSYEDIYSSLLSGGPGHADEYLLLIDFASYCDAQRRVGEAYGDSEKWAAMSLRNIARSGIFSADRAVREYADEIWRVRHK